MTECEECGSSENVKQFMFYDNRPDKRLCWDCRKPIVMDRVHNGNEDETEDDQTEDDQSTESESMTQTTLYKSW